MRLVSFCVLDGAANHDHATEYCACSRLARTEYELEAELVYYVGS